MSAAGSHRVLVIGATSGIGLETALALARRGDHVVVADRDVAGGEAAAARARLPPKAHAMPAK